MLLDREVELGRLERLLGQAGAGAGTAVVIHGPAGIGKTELLSVLVERAEKRGFVALRARGSEFESSMAFGAARQLFERVLQSASPARRRRLLAGAAEVGSRAIGAGGAEAPADRFAALHGLFWLCANLAERNPLIVAVDDLQWVDEQSLDWLGYLGRRCGELRVLVAATVRDGAAREARGELIEAISAAAIDHMALSSLSAESVSVLVRASLGAGADGAFCDVCHGLTGGNPFFLRELLAAARAQGLLGSADEVAAVRSIVPAAVGTSVLARLTQMGPSRVALARALAVLGDGAEVDAVAELAGLDIEAAELAADALAAAQILAPVRPLEFFHPLISAAVYRDVAPGARRLAHRRAASLVERDGDLGRVAAHLLATGPAGDPWVVARLLAAAGEATDRGAPDAAAMYLRRALAEPPNATDRPRLLLMLGEAEWRSGQPGAIAHLREALDAASDASTSIDAATALAFAYVITAQASLAVQTLEGALRAAGGDREVALALEGAIAAVGEYDERTAAAAGSRAEALLCRMGELPQLPIGVAAALAFHAAKSNRPASEVERLVERALAITADPPPQDFANALLATLWLTESYERALELCDAELTVARRRGDVADLAEIALYRAWVLLRQGELADAEAYSRWALERGEASVRLAASASLVETLIERDALAAAAEVLEACTDLIDSPFITALQCLYARGRLRAAQGRCEEALSDLLDCGERCRRLELRCVSGTPWRSAAALVQRVLGRGEEARRLVEEELELARAFGRPRAIGVALRARGLVDDDGGGSVSILREAVALLSGSPARLELARALTDHGTALRRRGARSEARQQLERGLDLAHACGARAIASRARGELIALGAKPRRDATSGRDALTASELRVARLAAQGMTNREIAQALYISAKTAEVHLSHVYRKLRIRSRSQLSAALAGPITAGRADEGVANVIS